MGARENYKINRNQLHMKIIPSKGEILIKIDDSVPAGILDTSSRKSSPESGIVMAVGEDVTEYKKGDVVIVKGWATDVTSYEGKTYTFVSLKTLGVKAKVVK